jgi:AAHS family 4-hydroxybenzoate transporter-like MFS transporter
VPAVFTVALYFWLPESPQFLKLRAQPQSVPGARVEKASIGQLFAPEFRRDTVGIWLAFFLCLIAIYSTFNWLPATISMAGFDQRTASLGLASFNFGGVAGALLAAAVITRVGSRTVMPPLSVAGALIAGAVAALNTRDMSPQLLLGMIAVLGFCVNGVQTTLFALAAHIYPSRTRSSGVGAALGFGRAGAVLSSLIGAAALASGSASAIFVVLAVAMAGTTVALLAISRQIIGSPARSVAVEA